MLGVVGLLSTTPAFAGDPATAGLFDWEGNKPSVAGINGVLWLTDGNWEDVKATLDLLPVDAPRAVKVREELTTGLSLFDMVEVTHVFANFEARPGTEDFDLTKGLAANVAASSMSSSALVGNFTYDPLNTDFAGSDVSMLNSNLYPGSPGFDHTAGPNIASALFLGPLARFADTEEAGTGLPNLPYVTRFNSNNNTALNNTTYMEPDGTVLDAFDTDDQMLSRGDFKAMVAHYRMRGADSVVLFEPGVVGYDKDTQLNDAAFGWTDVDDAFSGGTAVIEDNFEDVDEGTALSSVRNEDTVTILLSNLSESRKFIPLPDMFGESLVDHDSFRVRGGKHLLLTFGLEDGIWSLTDRDPSTFADNDRGGIGIPEPTSVATLATIGMILTMSRTKSGRREEV